MSLGQQIFQAGVVGAGGAGFPTHKKLVPGIELLIVNAAECEPLLASDRYLMRHQAGDIVAGIQAIRQAYGIPRVVIGTKAHYVRELAALRAAIAAAGADIEIHELPSFYPAGDEQTLVYEITGQTVPPGGVPIALGMAVSNVTTVYQIFQAGQGVPVTHRYVTVTGAVAHPVVVDAPDGTLVADLVAAAGGATVEPYFFVRGGPLMGRQYPGDAASTTSFGKADGGLVVLPADHPLVVFNHKPIEHLLNETRSACIQCQLCTELCPRYLIGHQMRPHRVMRAFQTGTTPVDILDALLCCECGICELFSCPMGLSPRKINIYAKRLLREKGITRGDQTIYPEHTRERAARRIAQSRFVERWQLGGYPADLEDEVALAPARVVIPLKHGVGQPATPCVAAGEKVAAGQVIATVDETAVGALVHASIDGRVTAVTEQAITIER